MAVAEIISHYVQRLPERLQNEVLDFVQYLLMKAEQEHAAQQEEDWSQLSLSLAMRNMEDEGHAYTTADLKETFS